MNWQHVQLPAAPSEQSSAIESKGKFSNGLTANSTQEETRKFLRYCYSLDHDQSSWPGEVLGEYFQDDFESLKWNEFKNIDKTVRRNMRDLLRARGFYLPIGNNIRVPTVLFEIVKEINHGLSTTQSNLHHYTQDTTISIKLKVIIQNVYSYL